MHDCRVISKPGMGRNDFSYLKHNRTKCTILHNWGEKTVLNEISQILDELGRDVFENKAGYTATLVAS